MENENYQLTTVAKILIAVALVVAAVLAQIFLMPWLGFGSDREMGIIATGYNMEYTFDSGAAFHSHDSRFFYYASRDGLRYIASNGNLIWSEAFTFNSPQISANGNFIAMGEERLGRTVRVFNETGELFSITMEHIILSFNVNETGFLTVIVQYDRGYGIYVFNQHRTQASAPLFRWTIFYDLISPTHAVVSADGRYIAIAVVDLNDDVRTSVQFRYINQWDAWGTEQGLFATEDFPGQFLTALRFMNENRLIIATTSQIVGFRLGPGHQVSQPIWDIQLNNVKTQIAFYNGTHFAFAVGERLSMIENEGDPLGLVRIYNTSGTPTGTFEMGRRVTHLRMGHNAVIVGGDRSFHATDFRGNPLWEHTSLFETRDVLFLDDTNIFLVAGTIHAEIFERRRLRESDFNDFSEIIEFEGEFLP
jgi:hypothetical protein